MKFSFLSLCLLLFACSSNNPVSTENQIPAEANKTEPIIGKIIFEFESVPPYSIRYPNETNTDQVYEVINPDSNWIVASIQKTTRILEYKFQPLTIIQFSMGSNDRPGHFVINITVQPDLTNKLLFYTYKDFTLDNDRVHDEIEFPF